MPNDDVYEPIRPPRFERRRLRGLEHHLSIWGSDDAPLIVYLHGWGDAGSTFQFVVDALAGDYRIVAPDFRGFGRSAHRPPAYWFPDYLADVDALLQLLSPDSPVVLIGHSMGGNVAGLYAGSMPERVSAFLNLEGFGLPDSDPQEAPARYRRWLEAIRAAPSFARYADEEPLVRRILENSPRMQKHRARFVARQWTQRDDDGRLTLRADPAHKLPNPVLYRRREAEACWRAITARVLLVCGADTAFGDAAATWRAADPSERPFPGAALEVLDDAGHMLHFEAPEALAGVIDRFLGRL